jgi:hypothetical protein
MPVCGVSSREFELEIQAEKSASAPTRRVDAIDASGDLRASAAIKETSTTDGSTSAQTMRLKIISRLYQN